MERALRWCKIQKIWHANPHPTFYIQCSLDNSTKGHTGVILDPCSGSPHINADGFGDTSSKQWVGVSAATTVAGARLNQQRSLWGLWSVASSWREYVRSRQMTRTQKRISPNVNWVFSGAFKALLLGARPQSFKETKSVRVSLVDIVAHAKSQIMAKPLTSYYSARATIELYLCLANIFPERWGSLTYN